MQSKYLKLMWQLELLVCIQKCTKNKQKKYTKHLANLSSKLYLETSILKST